MKRSTQRGLRSIGQKGGRKRQGETRLQKRGLGVVHSREWSAVWEAADRSEKVSTDKGL